MLKDAGNDPIKRAGLVSDIVRSIAIIPNSMIRAEYVKECSALLAVDEAMLYHEINKIKNTEQGKTVARPQNQPAEAIPHFEDMDGGDIYTSPYESEERNILELLIRYGQTLMYYANDDQKTPVTVAAYITEELENDDIAFQNPLHQNYKHVKVLQSVL